MEEDEVYDLVEVMQEIDHEVASKAFQVISAHQKSEGEREVRARLIKFRRALIRNQGLVEDMIKGLGKEYV